MYNQAVRDSESVLAEAVNAIRPSPVPVADDVIVIQVTSNAAVHVVEATAIMSIVPE